MPAGFLLPAFALVLLANAILIAVALRSMRRGGALDDRPFARPATPLTTRRPAPAAEPPQVSPARSDGPATAAAPPAEIAESPDPGPAPEPEERTEPPAPPRRAAARPKASATTTSRSGGRRRRFSLPPLDEDHEKVNRSIASFLDGGPSDDADPDVGSVTGATDGEPGQPPTTVALVAVSGPEDDDDEPTSPLGLAVAAVERALRGAARGTDRVETLAAGRYRIVLASTGELAARAYLRRVRATVEPLLEELDPPRRLVVATATALGEPLGRADDVAERRLDALLDATRVDDRLKPRAAGT
jgi:hypothetical protein